MAITGNFGTIEYREGGVIAIPLTFVGETNVIVPSKSICRIRHDSGSDLTSVNYRMIGKGRAFEVVVEIPPDRKGSFSVDITGTVLNTSTREWDSVTVDAKTVAYNTMVPVVENFEIPSAYVAGENFDVRVAYNVRITGLSDNNVHEVFILEGAANMMGTPTPYKWIGNSPPDFEESVPADLTETDWQQLQSPPAGVDITPENGFDENGFWHGTANEGQYFLIRWMVTEGTTGVFSMTPRPDKQVHGPVV